MDCFGGAFICMVINGFLLFFISLNSLFTSYGVFGFVTAIGRASIGTLTGIGTLIGTFSLTAAGFAFTNTVGI